MIPRPKIVAWLSWLALNTATRSMMSANWLVPDSKMPVILSVSTIGSGIHQPTR